MPFGVVSGVGREMGVLDGVVILEGEGTVCGEFGAFHCYQRELCCVVVRERRALPKLLWEDLFLFVRKNRALDTVRKRRSACRIRAYLVTS